MISIVDIFHAHYSCIIIKTFAQQLNNFLSFFLCIINGKILKVFIHILLEATAKPKQFNFVF